MELGNRHSICYIPIGYEHKLFCLLLSMSIAKFLLLFNNHYFEPGLYSVEFAAMVLVTNNVFF